MPTLGEFTASEQQAMAGTSDVGLPRLLLDAAYTLIRRSYMAAEHSMTLIAACGALTMPLYYVVWHILYPQPYENLWLRLVGSLLCAPFVVRRHWPRALRPLQPILWYAAVLYVLPFFFGFMMLMNGASVVWLLSSLVALFLLVLLVDWINLVILFTLGSLLAFIVVNCIDPARAFSAAYLPALPVFIFGLITGGIFSYRSELLAQERLRAAAEVGSGIGQDLRTPLLGIKTGAISLQNHLPTLLRGHDMALAAGLKPPDLPPKVRGALEHAVQRIIGEAEHVGTIIDMLQINAGALTLEGSAIGVWPMSQCIETALRLYPFRDERSRRAIQWRRDVDFSFAGSDILMSYLLMNLIKNGLQGIARAGKGQIVVRLERAGKLNRLHFSYAETDAVASFSSRLFDPSLLAADAGIEAASSLAFCQRVAEAFHGSLRCRSQRGGYREFVLSLPAAGEEPLP